MGTPNVGRRRGACFPPGCRGGSSRDEITRWGGQGRCDAVTSPQPTKPTRSPPSRSAGPVSGSWPRRTGPRATGSPWTGGWPRPRPPATSSSSLTPSECDPNRRWPRRLHRAPEPSGSSWRRGRPGPPSMVAPAKSSTRPSSVASGEAHGPSHVHPRNGHQIPLVPRVPPPRASGRRAGAGREPQMSGAARTGELSVTDLRADKRYEPIHHLDTLLDAHHVPMAMAL